MLSKYILRYVVKKAKFSSFGTCERRPYSKKTSRPLRILFCGSDAFSCESLRALHQEHQRDKEGIVSIDVLCRPGKLSGRSMKFIKEVPLKGVAQELGLTIHERDTFTGWDLPKPGGESINLIIAVSFGLFVPPRILKGAEYGGLNVHPSLLPNFRGPAPLHHTIMNGERFTGVTLQTLDSQSFDHGTILAQTPYPGLQIDGYRKIKYADLLDLITPIAADMLIKGIRDRVFVPPLPQLALPSLPDKLIHARKIRTEDREVDWRSWDAVAIERRYRALGPLWNTILLDDKTPVRIKFEDFELVEKPAISNEWYTQQQQKRTTQCENREKDEEDSKKVDMSEVKFMVYLTKTGHKLPLLFIKDGEAIIILARRMALRVSQITAAGMGKRAASMAAEGLRGDKTWRVVPGTQSHTSDEHMQQNRAEQLDFAQNHMNTVEKLE